MMCFVLVFLLGAQITKKSMRINCITVALKLYTRVSVLRDARTRAA